MWDGTKYILITTVIQITNVIVSKDFLLHVPKTPKQPWHTSDTSGVLWFFTLHSSNAGFSSASVISLGLTLGEDSLSSQQGSII